VVREGTADERPHRRFGRVVGGGDGIKSVRAAFVLDAQRRAEKRQDCLARDRGKLVDESRKVDPVMLRPPSSALPVEVSKSRAPGNLRARVPADGRLGRGLPAFPSAARRPGSGAPVG